MSGEPSIPALARAVLEAKKVAYSDGLRDGVLMVLDHIEGTEDATATSYTGPLPDELRAWLAGVRRRA